jgi:hypothetical protein
MFCCVDIFVFLRIKNLTKKKEEIGGEKKISFGQRDR